MFGSAVTELQAPARSLVPVVTVASAAEVYTLKNGSLSQWCHVGTARTAAAVTYPARLVLSWHCEPNTPTCTARHDGKRSAALHVSCLFCALPG